MKAAVLLVLIGISCSLAANQFCQIVTGLSNPIDFREVNGSHFIAQKAGTILRCDTDDSTKTCYEYLDITATVGASGGEQGLLSIAFHPDWENNGYMYALMTIQSDSGATVVYRYQHDGFVIDPNTETTVYGPVPQFASNHNGGTLLFGADGYLYISSGDGGGSGDPQEQGQDFDTALGSIIRIDVDCGDPYAIPSDNPNFGSGQSEIFAYGLRNPWRMSIDDNQWLWIADVGQGAWEEVDIIDLNDFNNDHLNLGWNCYEGDTLFDMNCIGGTAKTFLSPVHVYDHSVGNSITGGHVHKGSVAAYEGDYIFADYGSGRIWHMSFTGTPYAFTKGTVTEFQSITTISSFGQSSDGESYLVTLGTDSLYKLIAGECTAANAVNLVAAPTGGNGALFFDPNVDLCPSPPSSSSGNSSSSDSTGNSSSSSSSSTTPEPTDGASSSLRPFTILT